MITDHNDYDSWLKYGSSWERIISDWCNEILALRLSPQEQPSMDFKGSFEVDIKARLTVFRKARDFIGLDPSEALPINVNKATRYVDKLHDRFILFVVKFDEYPQVEGLYLLTARKLQMLMENYPNRYHVYASRNGEDRNAVKSFYVSTKECFRLTHNVRAELDRIDARKEDQQTPE